MLFINHLLDFVFELFFPSSPSKAYLGALGGLLGTGYYHRPISPIFSGLTQLGSLAALGKLTQAVPIKMRSS